MLLALFSEGGGWKDKNLVGISFLFQGNLGFVMAKKVQVLKAKLKEYNKNVFGILDRKIDQNLIDIQNLIRRFKLMGCQKRQLELF